MRATHCLQQPVGFLAIWRSKTGLVANILKSDKRNTWRTLFPHFWGLFLVLFLMLFLVFFCCLFVLFRVFIFFRGEFLVFFLVFIVWVALPLVSCHNFLISWFIESVIVSVLKICVLNHHGLLGKGTSIFFKLCFSCFFWCPLTVLTVTPNGR